MPSSCFTVKQKIYYSRSEGVLKNKLPVNLYFREVDEKSLALSYRSSMSSREPINTSAKRTLLINTSSEAETSSSSVYESYRGVRARVHQKKKG